MSGSPTDQFDVEGTPNSAPHVTIQNYVTTGTSAGVYVMGKSVMPLTVIGNFALYVGRRLNSDGTVTNVGQVDAVFNPNNTFMQYGVPLPGGFPQFLIQNGQLVIPNNLQLVPGVTYNTYVVGGSGPPAPQNPLPVFFNYTGQGQSTMVFDTSGDVLNQGTLGKISFGTYNNYDGVSSNSLFAGEADLRFLQGDVIYTSNVETFDYGPQVVGAVNTLDKAGMAMLIDNPIAAPFHYIANTKNLADDVEEILIGRNVGPVSVQGGGASSRVEINPLFSLPTTSAAIVLFNNQSLIPYPGWNTVNAGGYSLRDTIQADVTVSNAALRVISDIPLPTGMTGPASLPDVHISGSQITGIGTGNINYSGLVNDPFANESTSFGPFGGDTDMGTSEFPGLSIELPAHAPAKTFVDDTPSGVTTLIDTMLSSSASTTNAGPITVLGTTGPLMLGQFWVAFSPAVHFQYPVATGVPVGVLAWNEGLSTPQITIGNGSVQNIKGAVLIAGDTQQNTVTTLTVDGRNDPATTQPKFVTPNYNSAPYGIIYTYKDPSLALGVFGSELDNFAPGPILFGGFLSQMPIFGSWQRQQYV